MSPQPENSAAPSLDQDVPRGRGGSLPADAGHIVTTFDLAEGAASRLGQEAADIGSEVDSVHDFLARRWAGRAGREAVRRVDELQMSIKELSGHLFFLSDVLRVEGSRLARALTAGGEDFEVDDADRVLAARLRQAAGALAGRGAPSSEGASAGREAPGGGDAGQPDCVAVQWNDPRFLAGQWHSLDPDQRLRLLRQYPELGNTDGIPADQRDAVNRERLDRYLDAQIAPAAHSALKEYLAEDPRRMLLSVDAEGKAAVASGNPDTAVRVLSFVPGTGSEAESISLSAERAENVCAAATGAQDPGQQCVSVAWQGYAAPPTLVDAGTSAARAEANASELRSFAAGIDAVDRLDGVNARHDLLGYSYGSTVLGKAAGAPEGLAADRMVHVGSPGAGVASLAEQWVDDNGRGRPATQPEVIGAASRWDAVPWWSETGILGTSPSDPRFGATVIDLTDPGENPLRNPGVLIEAHTRYFEPDSFPLSEIGRALKGSA